MSSPTPHSMPKLFSIGRAPLRFSEMCFSCRGVQWIHSRSAGLEQVLFPELIKSEVILTNGSGVFSPSLGEFALVPLTKPLFGLQPLRARYMLGLGGFPMPVAPLPDEFWRIVESFMPSPKTNPKGGRPRSPDRACLAGIIFVLRTGIPWEMLPQELGCGSGMTCWRRLRDWQEAGIWQLIHFAILDWLARSERIDWSRAVVDGSSIRAVFGGRRPVPIRPIGPSPAASVI